MADPAANVTVTVKPNGPLLVVGPITLVDPTGQPVALPAGRAGWDDPAAHPGDPDALQAGPV